jgi:hypothetical protein
LTLSLGGNANKEKSVWVALVLVVRAKYGGVDGEMEVRGRGKYA